MSRLKNFTKGIFHKFAVVFFTEASGKVFFITARDITKSFLVGMKAWMFMPISKKKILNSIVDDVSVYVMNFFVSIKVATKMLFHNKSMLKNIPVSFGKWVVRFSYHNISPAIFSLSAFPVRMFSHFPSKLKCSVSILLPSFFVPDISSSWHDNIITNYGNKDN